jgi:acyl-CoA thioester hydrolase
MNPALLELYTDRVRPEWIDANGHMNVAYYMLAFDGATDAFLDYLGLGTQYTEATGGSTFTAEAHISYLREVLEGNPLRFTTQLLAYDAKRFHYVHCMYQANAAYLAATCEFMVLSVDLKERRVAPLPASALTRLDDVLRAHADLPTPEQVGHVIGIRQSRDEQ